MHPKYAETLQQITAWAAGEPGIRGLVLIGSQARRARPADAWSDLDLMALVDDPQALLGEPGWLGQFGQVVCWFDEVVPLPGRRWRWCVRRVLYADARDVDFSLLPQDCLDEVLEVNRDILAKGWQVLSADDPDALEGQIRAALVSIHQTREPPGEAELRQVVSNLLFHLIWALKKVRRGELWVAVSCINSYMKDLLQRLIEAHNTLVSQKPDGLGYNGRFLEQRSDPAVLRGLAGCFTRYDPAQAVESLGCLLDLVSLLWREVCAQAGWRYDPVPFEQVREMLASGLEAPASGF